MPTGKCALGSPRAHFPILFFSRLSVQPEGSKRAIMVDAVNFQIANNAGTAPGNSPSQLNREFAQFVAEIAAGQAKTPRSLSLYTPG
jgi:hypothetical protein